MIVEKEARKITPTSLQARFEQVGFWLLWLLVLTLPFELTQMSFFESSFLVLSNLKLVYYLVVITALVTLTQPVFQFVRFLLSKRSPQETNYLYRQRWAIMVFGLFLVSCLIATVQARELSMVGEGIKWTAFVLTGGLLWLAIPFWLTKNATRKIQLLSLAFVAGAVISAIVGFLEFILGMGFAQSLGGWFKAKPTTAGPFLRLSGTFDYANIAAMYFELALPVALAWLIKNLSRTPKNQRYWLGIVGWIIIIAILLAAILLTLSRGAWLGTGIGLLAILLATRRKSNSGKRRFWWMATGILAALGLGFGLLATFFLAQFNLRFSSQSDQDWYRMAFDSTLPATMSACQELDIPVTVHNLSPLVWYAAGPIPYHLSYHWLYQDGQIAQFEGIRSTFKADIQPQQSQQVVARLTAPAKPGNYWLVWDIVQEDISWFSLKSSRYEKLPIQVEVGSCATIAESITKPELTPTVLPKIIQQPDRKELWAAALNMLRARPFWGVGPNSFRFNYGYYASPPLIDWDKRVFANSFPLEILANLGLVGGLLFAAFGLLIGSNLIKITLSGRSTSLWQTALIGIWAAFLGHGLVDYILGSNAIFMLFWILLGLTSAQRLLQHPESSRK